LSRESNSFSQIPKRKTKNKKAKTKKAAHFYVRLANKSKILSLYKDKKSKKMMF